MPVRGEEDRRYEARYDGRDPPGYRRRNEPEPQHAEPERIISMERRAPPHDFRRGFEDVSYKVSSCYLTKLLIYGACIVIVYSQ